MDRKRKEHEKAFPGFSEKNESPKERKRKARKKKELIRKTAAEKKRKEQKEFLRLQNEIPVWPETEGKKKQGKTGPREDRKITKDDWVENFIQAVEEDLNNSSSTEEVVHIPNLQPAGFAPIDIQNTSIEESEDSEEIITLHQPEMPTDDLPVGIHYIEIEDEDSLPDIIDFPTEDLVVTDYPEEIKPPSKKPKTDLTPEQQKTKDLFKIVAKTTTPLGDRAQTELHNNNNLDNRTKVDEDKGKEEAGEPEEAQQFETIPMIDQEQRGSKRSADREPMPDLEPSQHEIIAPYQLDFKEVQYEHVVYVSTEFVGQGFVKDKYAVTLNGKKRYVYLNRKEGNPKANIINNQIIPILPNADFGVVLPQPETVDYINVPGTRGGASIKRFKGNKLFITYKYCQKSPEEILQNLRRTYGDAIEIIVTREVHANGQYHIHVLIQWPVNKPRDINVHLSLDKFGYSPDELKNTDTKGYYKGTGDWDRTAAYILKEFNGRMTDKNISYYSARGNSLQTWWNTNGKNMSEKSKKKGQGNWGQVMHALQNGTKTAAELLNDPKLGPIVGLKYKSVQNIEKKLRENKRPDMSWKKFKFKATDPKNVSMIKLWLNANIRVERVHRQPQLLLRGKANTGKSWIVDHFLPSKGLNIYHMGDESFQDPFKQDEIDLIHFSELCEKQVTREQFLRMLAGDTYKLAIKNEFTVTVTRNIPIIMTTNLTIEEIIKTFRFAGEQVNAFLGRINVIDIESNLPENAFPVPGKKRHYFFNEENKTIPKAVSENYNPYLPAEFVPKDDEVEVLGETVKSIYQQIDDMERKKETVINLEEGFTTPRNFDDIAFEQEQTGYLGKIIQAGGNPIPTRIQALALNDEDWDHADWNTLETLPSQMVLNAFEMETKEQEKIDVESEEEEHPKTSQKYTPLYLGDRRNIEEETYGLPEYKSNFKMPKIQEYEEDEEEEASSQNY